jgi:putative transposase
MLVTGIFPSRILDINRVQDWPYSTFHRYGQSGILPIDWVGVIEVESKDFGENDL